MKIMEQQECDTPSDKDHMPLEHTCEGKGGLER